METCGDWELVGEWTYVLAWYPRYMDIIWNEMRSVTFFEKNTDSKKELAKLKGAESYN